MGWYVTAVHPTTPRKILKADFFDDDMPYLKNEATAEVREAVQAVEDRSDECYHGLRLLNRPRNLAMWSLLTAIAHELETFHQKFGANSTRHRIALIKLERCICGFHFIALHGRPESNLVTSYTYNGSLVTDAMHAHNVSRQYTDFLNIFPLWHRNHERIELMPSGAVRFHLPRDSARQRQVIAYQLLFRPVEGVQAKPKEREQSPEVKRLFNELFQQARPHGLQKKFQYEASPELIEALRPEYQERLDSNFRHPDSIQLNSYSLAEFKSVYVALLILCAIHEHICYPWEQPGYPIPTSSLVMVKQRSHWVRKLSTISQTPLATCEAIIEDLTLKPENRSFTSLCITPFVPLDRNGNTLAVAPQFPLISAVDENILRQFSYLYPSLFSAQNTQKEEGMRSLLRSSNPGYRIDFSIPIPDRSTEIDFLIEDEASSTVVLAELKWLRKPFKPFERIEREKDLEKGVMQLETIRAYGREHPGFLRERGKLSQDLSDYRAVHHLLLVRDYWHWVEPRDSLAAVYFDEFLRRFRGSTALNLVIDGLLRYDWLPIEEQDFHVGYTVSSVNGASVESALFREGRRPSLATTKPQEDE